MTGVQPAGHQKVARPFRRTAAQDWCLDLEEPDFRHCPPHELGQTVPEHEDLDHGRPAQIEITMCQPELFVGLGPMHLEWRGRRGVINDEITSTDLDSAGLELGIRLAGQPRGHDPLDSHHVFIAQLRPRA